MSARILAAIFAVCFFGFGLASLPLSAAIAALSLDMRGITYSRAEGTFWNGRIHGLFWHGRDFGEASLIVHPWSLMLARLDADVVLAGQGAVSGSGRITVWPNASVELRSVAIIADVAMLPVVLPLKGSFRLDIRHADFSRAGCRSVDADLQTNALVDRPAGLNWRGPVLSGAAVCTNGILTLPLVGGDAREVVAVTMKLAGDGTFNVQVEARTTDETVKRALSVVGFTDVDGAMTLIQNGRWS